MGWRGAWALVLLAAAATGQPLELHRSFTISEEAPQNTLIGHLQEPPLPKGSHLFAWLAFPKRN